jgi:hypothetical protein
MCAAGWGPELIEAVVGTAAQGLRALKVVIVSRSREEDKAASLSLIGRLSGLEQLIVSMGSRYIFSLHTHPAMRSVAPYQMPRLLSLKWFHTEPFSDFTPFLELLARSTFPQLQSLTVGVHVGVDSARSHRIQMLAPFMERHRSIKRVRWHLPPKLSMEAIALPTSADFLAFVNPFELSHVADAVPLSPSVRVIAIWGPNAVGLFDSPEVVALYESVLALSAVPDIGSLREIHISLGETPFRWKKLIKWMRIAPPMFEKLQGSIANLMDRGLSIIDADGCTLDVTPDILWL